MVVNETKIVEACRKGDVKMLREMAATGKKLSAKSRVKVYDNLFQRALDECANQSNELEIIEVLCSWAKDVNELIDENDILAMLAKGRHHVIDTLIKYGCNIEEKSSKYKYKTIFDRMFRESISLARVDNIKYLMKYFDIKIVNVDSIINFLANEEDFVSHIDRKLANRGSETLLNFMLSNGLNMNKLIEVLNK